MHTYKARYELRCPLSRRSHRALVLDVSVAATKAPWASRQLYMMKGCTTEEDAKRLIDLIRVMLVLDPADRPSAEAHLLVLDVRWRSLRVHVR